MSTASDIIEPLLARCELVQPHGAGFTARCPAHEDHSPSLSINPGE
jgi:DNA primase